MVNAQLSSVVLAAFAALAACGQPTAPPPAAPQAPPVRVASLNAAPGAMVQLEPNLVPGYVTIVDFWAEWCVACKSIESMLLVDLQQEPGVVIRKVDVGAGDSEVARAYQIGGLPHLRIFDRRGRLRYVLVGQDAHQASAAALTLAREP